MKRRLFTPILALGLILCLMAPAANAWEFDMDGTFTWLYEYRGQQGTNGFFGAYDTAVDDGAAFNLNAGAYAPYNFYTGGFYLASLNATTANRIDRGAAALGGRPYVGSQIVSGSDASWGTMYMSTNMQIRMNPAVRIRGNYYIGSWNTPNSATSLGRLTHFEYLQMEGHGAQRSFSPGYWRTLWLTAQLPWGEIAVGKRPSSWGMGMAFGGPDNRSSESLYLGAPFGPIRVGIGFYTARDGYMTDDYGNPAAGFYNWQADKNNRRIFDTTLPQIVYSQGPLNAGAYVNWMARRRGGESRIANPGNAAGQRAATQTRDYSEWYGGAFFKYNNGRFFLNSEINTLQAVDRRSGAIPGGGIANTANQMAWPVPVVTDHWDGAVEAGVLAGPAKVAVLGAWLTGNDYRYAFNGLAGGERLALITGGLQPDAWSNTGVFRPYSYLMVYSYGLGTSFARDTGDGWVQDASIYAGRLDYAVAANLNIFGSFMWAERFSKSGNLWGCLQPYTANGAAAAAADNSTNGQVVYQNIDYNLIAGGNSRPTIPDTALGYEIDFGFDWKLLEALTARCTVAYWVPGKWWSYATVDKNQVNWGRALTGDLAAGPYWGANPGKTIDPLWGMEFKLEGTF